MAINYTLLFTRLGSLMGLVRATNTANYAAAQTNINTVLSQFTANPTYAQALSAVRDSVASSLSQPIYRSSSDSCVTTAVEQVNGTLYALAPKTELVALRALIADMVTTANTIQSSTVAATLTAGSSNTGTGSGDRSVALTATVDRQNCYAETIRLTCVRDRSSGLQYSGNETWTFAGEAAAPFWYSTWPLGSGATGTFATCSAATGGGQNGPNLSLVIGGAFETFVSGVPTYFEAVTGSALMASSTDSLRGTYAAQVTGNGATQYQYRQKFGQTSSGVGLNPTLPQPNTRYQVGVWMKYATSHAAGVIRLSLKNTAGTVLGSVSVNVSALTTSYVYYSFQYLTGDSVDANMAIVLESTTAVGAGDIIRHDELTCVQMVEAYASGPLFAIVAGGTDYAVNDLFTLAVTNNRAGVFQQEFARMFPSVLANRLVITSGGSPTISDSLVTV